MRKMELVIPLIALVLSTGNSLAIAPPPTQKGAKLGLPISYFRTRPSIVDEIPGRYVRPVGECRCLVLLVDFTDKPAQVEPEFIREKLFSRSGPSMHTYFEENSYGKFGVSGEVFGWLRSPCDHSLIVNRDGSPGTADDYGLDTTSSAIDTTLCSFPLNIWGLVAQTVREARDLADLSLYDNDGPDGLPSSGDDDGYIDALIIVHSGQGAEMFANMPGGIAANYIWSLQSDLSLYGPTSNTIVDGKLIGPFIIVPEMGEIGVFAHEFCHLLGLPDLYNTENGLPVVGPLCLMDEGAWNGPPNRLGSVPSHLCAPMKYFLGWIDPVAVCIGCEGTETVSGAVLEPIGLTPDAYRILGNPNGVDWTPRGNGRGEYFMLEDRQPLAGYFETYLPGSGLLIWRVDESQKNNNNPKRWFVELVQADGERLDPEIKNAADPRRNVPGEESDFWPGSLEKHEFTPLTHPASVLAYGRYSGVSVTNINETPSGEIVADIATGAPRKGTAYAFPNPFKLGSGTKVRIVFLPEPGPDRPHPGSFRAMIFDLEGNFVRNLDESSEILDNGTALWDARDEAGRLVQPGLYFYHVQSSGQEARGTIAVKE